MEQPPHGTPLSADDPEELGGYRLLRRLGAGGMGTVYLGKSASSDSGRLVAVKVIRPELTSDDDYLARFRDEALLARRVSPFCTAQVVDYGTEKSIPYLVTEFVEGASLDEVVREQGSLTPSTVHGIAVGVAAALTAIHAAGLMHRDLKPTNVLLSQSGPRVIDFGIAKPTEGSTGRKSTVGVLVGTPGWIAPELLVEGDVTTAVDVWSWGCLVAYATNGRHPFGRGNAAAIAYRALHDPPNLGELTGQLESLVRTALDPVPAERPKAQRLLLELVGGSNDDTTSDSAGTREAVSAFLGDSWSPPPTAPGVARPPTNSGPRPPVPAGNQWPPHVAGQGRWPSGPQHAPSGPRPPVQPAGYPSGPRPAPTGQAAPWSGPTGTQRPAGTAASSGDATMRHVAIGGVIGLAILFVIVLIIAIAS